MRNKDGGRRGLGKRGCGSGSAEGWQHLNKLGGEKCMGVGACAHQGFRRVGHTLRFRSGRGCTPSCCSRRRSRIWSNQPGRACGAGKAGRVLARMHLWEGCVRGGYAQDVAPGIEGGQLEERGERHLQVAEARGVVAAV